MKKFKPVLLLASVLLATAIAPPVHAGERFKAGLSYDTFATANLDTPDNPTWGAGLGVNAFVTERFGVSGELVTENTNYKVFDGANASLVFREPIGDRVAPYAFLGGGYLFERESWQGHAGAGIEVAVTDNFSLFGDARWVTPVRESRPDYPAARAGLRFKF